MGEPCDEYVIVDYGNGPLRVKCTEKGPHEEHSYEFKIPKDAPVVHKNVFEGE